MVARALSSNGSNVDFEPISHNIVTTTSSTEQRQRRKALNAINTNSARQHRAKVRALASDPDLKGSKMQMKPQLLTRLFLR
jgi:hypothetical protein